MIQSFLSAVSLPIAWAALNLLPQKALAQSVYNGEGINAGIDAASNLGVSSGGNFRDVLGSIVNTALSYVALLAVVVLIVAGLYLILGLGSENSKETAKKIVLYVAVGLLIILLSKIFVEFIKSVVLVD